MLDKAIEYGKEWRKPFYGAKAIDRTCRNHGSCSWCYKNRTYGSRKRVQESDSKFKDYYEDALKALDA